MEKEENTMAMNDEPVRSKKHARLHRSFSYISKALIKKLHVGAGHANTNDKSPSSSSGSFLSGCMHPRTNSFVSSRRRRCRKATAVDGGRNKHHYDDDDDGDLAVDFQALWLGAAADGGSSSTQNYYTDDGTSGEEGGDAPAAAGSVVLAGGFGGVAVVTFSAAPYEDFRRSMREMVDVAQRDAGAASPPAVDWDLMEELLFCYLELNDRAVHGDILRAFTDTVAALRRRRRRPAVAPSSSAASKARLTRRHRRRRRDGEQDLHDDGGKAAGPVLHVSPVGDCIGGSTT